jgi:uncharacterized membrane protein YiaA
MRRRNTGAFTFAAWAFFTLSILAEYVGIYNLDEPLSVKGYYAVTGLCLLMSAIVLQKTVRDNQEDADEAARHAE